MPGLINKQVENLQGDTTKDTLAPDDPNVVKTVTGVGYDPALRNVDPNQTVSGQLNKVLASDSPLMTQARQQTVEQANARGLQNSSMAAGAGESAAIGAALPIATADANVYGQTAQQNVEAKNTASQFGAGAKNRAGEVSAAAVNTAQTIKQQQVAQTGLIEAQTKGSSQLSAQTAAQAQAQEKLRGEIETGLQTLRGTQSKDLANIEANYKQLMQANSSAASLFNESMQQIATILRDPNTSAEQKSSAVTGITTLLNSALAVAGSISNLDLTKLLNFGGTTPVPAGTTPPNAPGVGPAAPPPAAGGVEAPST